MYGTRGGLRRRRLIRAEFAAGVAACTALGVLALVQGSGGWLVLGVWLIGIGANYIPLAVEAQRLSRGGRLEAEIADLDLRREPRSAARAQLWILVPFAVCLAAVARQRR